MLIQITMESSPAAAVAMSLVVGLKAAHVMNLAVVLAGFVNTEVAQKLLGVLSASSNAYSPPPKSRENYPLIWNLFFGRNSLRNAFKNS